MKKIILTIGIALSAIATMAQPPYLQSQTYDVSKDFGDYSNTYFFADKLADLDVSSASGHINWKRYTLDARQAFNTTVSAMSPLKMLDFPEPEYDNDPNLPFKVDFIGPRTVRVRVYTSPVIIKEAPSVMFADGMPTVDASWKYSGVSSRYAGNGHHGEEQ